MPAERFRRLISVCLRAMLRSMRSINKLVIHCSASPNGQAVTAAELDAWHKARGFKRTGVFAKTWQVQFQHIGYHYVIDLNGSVINGRHPAEMGAHVAGSNANSLGICMVGTDAFTAKQWAALKSQVESVQRGWPGITVVGHRDLSPDLNGDGIIQRNEWLKICPGFDVATWLRASMQPEAKHVLGALK